MENEKYFEDIKEFKDYVDKFVDVVEKSKDSTGIDKNGKTIDNYVVDGTLEKATLSSGLKLGKRYAAAGNRLYVFPYISNQGPVNIYYDWKPKLFDEPTLFVSVREVDSKEFLHSFEGKSEAVNRKINGYEAATPVHEIDYELLMEAMMKLQKKN